MRSLASDIEGFVLAGGASRRMGADKSRLTLGGLTLLERAALALGIIGRTRIVGATPGAHDDFGTLGEAPHWLSSLPDVSFVTDVYRTPDGRSPRSSLTGLHSALWHARSEWVAVVACDLPLVTSELFVCLASLRGERGEYEAVVPIQPDGRRQPLCALYRRVPALRRATEALDRNDYELNALIALLRTREVMPDELAALPGARCFFTNVNTPEDYRRLKDEGDEPKDGRKNLRSLYPTPVGAHP